MKLPEGLRERFKEPLGLLIPDREASRARIMDEAGPDAVLVTVGDATSARITGFGLLPLLQIVDGIEQRKARSIPGAPPAVARIKCSNPPGQISPECVGVIRRCLAGTTPSRLEVDGEEDLLVIPACIHAPDGAVVMYGQPNEGLVIIHISPKTRDKTRSLLGLMEGV